MKKVLAIVLSLVLVFALVACGNGGSDTDSGDKPLLVVFMPSADHGFTAESIEQCVGALEVTSAEKGFEYKVYNTDDAGEQTDQIATALEMYEIDTVLLWPIDGSPLTNAAQSIMDAGIPLVVYDRLIPDFTPTAEMTGDQVAVGTEAANYFNTYFEEDIAAGETIHVLIFEGDTSEAAVERTSSYNDNIDSAFVTDQTFLTMWSRDTGYEQMTDWLSNSTQEAIDQVRAIYTHDDEPLLGILQALREYGKQTNIEVLVGVGAQKAVLDEMQPALDELGLNIVTNTYAPGMIRQAVDLAVGIMYGSGETGLHLVPVEQVRLDNADEYRQSDEYKYRYPDEA